MKRETGGEGAGGCLRSQRRELKAEREREREGERSSRVAPAS